MNNETVTPCQYAMDRHRNLVLWRNLWTILLFGFGTAVVFFLIMAILWFIRESWLPAAVSMVGTIVSGAGIKWVVERRTEAVGEEKEAYKDVQDACRTVTLAPGGKSPAEKAAEFADKHKLFWLFR